MHVVVCVKQVPDTTQVRIDPATNTLIREGVPAVVNPYDLYALESALELQERCGASVTLLSMGPPDAVKTLKKCLSYGADRAILLTDRAFAGADTWATSYALAAAIRRLSQEHRVDLVICGKQTIDGDTAQTGPGIARHLGWQQCTCVERITDVNHEAGSITVERKLECGLETVRTALPAVFTVVESAQPIRYAGLPALVRAARSIPEVWSAKELDVDPACLGLKGSPTRVKKTFVPAQRSGGECVVTAEIGLRDAVASAVRVMESAELL